MSHLPGSAVEHDVKSLLSRCYALILAGGSGTRLWPLSRALMPKQLLALQGEQTLLQQTVLRTLNVFGASHIHVITNEEHIFEVKNQLKTLDESEEMHVHAEPVGRNTLPAILLGAAAVLGDEPEPLFAVFPSDHFIHDAPSWEGALRKGIVLAEQGWFVTFGLTPGHPETGYGYIAQGAPLGDDCYEVAGFIEKPDSERARQFLESGQYLWNSGMFMFSAKALSDAVEAHQPELAAWWEQR